MAKSYRTKWPIYNLNNFFILNRNDLCFLSKIAKLLIDSTNINKSMFYVALISSCHCSNDDSIGKYIRRQ